jgi:hypothetical protein
MSMRGRMVWVLAIGLVLLGAISCAQGVRNAIDEDRGNSKDLQWAPSRYLLHGTNPYRLYQQYKSGALSENPFLLAQFPNYPASSIVVLWPIAALDFDTAKVLWAGLNVAATAGTVYLLGRLFGLSLPLTLALGGLFFVSTPVRNTIGNGQQGLVSLFFFLAALWLNETKKPLWACALCLALSWLKFTVTVPLSLIFLAHRDGRLALAGAVAIHVILTLALSWWTATNPIALLMGSLAVNETGLWSDMFDFLAITRYLDIPSRLPGLLLGLVLLGLAAVVLVRDRRAAPVDLALLGLVSVVWTHHSGYDYFVLVLPLAYVCMQWRELMAHPAGRLAIALTCFAVLMVWYGQRVFDALATRIEAPWLTLTMLAAFIATGISLYALLVLLFVRRSGRAAAVVQAQAG